MLMDIIGKQNDKDLLKTEYNGKKIG